MEIAFAEFGGILLAPVQENVDLLLFGFQGSRMLLDYHLNLLVGIGERSLAAKDGDEQGADAGFALFTAFAGELGIILYPMEYRWQSFSAASSRSMAEQVVATHTMPAAETFSREASFVSSLPSISFMAARWSLAASVSARRRRR